MGSKIINKLKLVGKSAQNPQIPYSNPPLQQGSPSGNLQLQKLQPQVQPTAVNPFSTANGVRAAVSPVAQSQQTTYNPFANLASMGMFYSGLKGKQ